MHAVSLKIYEILTIKICLFKLNRYLSERIGLLNNESYFYTTYRNARKRYIWKRWMNFSVLPQWNRVSPYHQGQANFQKYKNFRK